MQYHIQTLVKHLFDKDSFEQVSVEELKQFTDDYPYAAVGQFLYAKKLKDSGAYNNYEQGEQASLYFHNALWLRWQLDQKEEAPALPAKAEEAAQQPGFRIVVQMPKNGPVYADQPETETEENKEEPVTQEASTQPIEETPVENIQPKEDFVEPVQEDVIEVAHGKPLQVNENGSLVEQEATQEETPAVSETASAVAIAEISQLGGEQSAVEAPLNAVSITEEALAPVAAVTENTETDDIIPAVEPIVGEADIDDVVPAVEVPAEMTNPAAVPTEVDDIVPAIEIEEADTDDVVPAIEVTAEEAQPEIVAEVATPAATAPPEIAIEEQPEPIAEPVPVEEPVAFVATQEPVIEEAVSAVPEEPEAAEPVAEQPNPFGFTPASKELKISVDLGEPIFESYHTIDYFASQGIKLMAEDLKDKMGKQLKSFTDWLRSMKRVSGHIEASTSIDEVTHQSIQRIAEHSVEEKEVVTEAMAEVWAKQGNAKKAIRIYEKLSLLNPGKSTYFATRIEQLKA
jgi:hypothetical protein